MDKRSKFALYLIGAVIVFMMVAEVTKPKALNWRDSFSAADKIPLGCYVLFNEGQSFLRLFDFSHVSCFSKRCHDFLRSFYTYVACYQNHFHFIHEVLVQVNTDPHQALHPVCEICSSLA